MSSQILDIETIWTIGNLLDIERWPDIQPDTGYKSLEISQMSGIRPKSIQPNPNFNFERWPDIQPDTRYKSLEISRMSGIRPKKYPAQP